MYLRHTTVKKNGKIHTYWRLVQSVRIGRRVVQRTVTTLGELDAEGRAKAKALASQFGAGGTRQLRLFEDDTSRATAPVPVHIDRIRLERSRGFGAVWLGWTLWRALKFDEICQRLIPSGREEIPWSEIAAILVIARLCE